MPLKKIGIPNGTWIPSVELRVLVTCVLNQLLRFTIILHLLICLFEKSFRTNETLVEDECIPSGQMCLKMKATICNSFLVNFSINLVQKSCILGTWFDHFPNELELSLQTSIATTHSHNTSIVVSSTCSQIGQLRISITFLLGKFVIVGKMS